MFIINLFPPPTQFEHMGVYWLDTINPCTTTEAYLFIVAIWDEVEDQFPNLVGTPVRTEGFLVFLDTGLCVLCIFLGVGGFQRQSALA